MSTDVVEPEEVLYRRIPFGMKEMTPYTRLPDGTIRITSQAFAERNSRLSVDRAKLCGTDPYYTLGDPDNGVISLVAKDIRGLTIEHIDPNTGSKRIFNVDVSPDPILPGNPEGRPPNPAHAWIHTSPERDPGKTVYRKLCQKLASIATARLAVVGWEIAPKDLRSQDP